MDSSLTGMEETTKLSALQYFNVAGRDDVLVMDRIQGRHLWDDGRFEGANIYDGF